MPIHIANWFEADRRSAKAGETITEGMVVKALDWGNGERKLMKLADGDSANLVAGGYGVVVKVSADAEQVSTSTAPSALGSRLVTISSGDQVVEVRKGAIIEYSADLLHSSLDPARSGATPAATTALAIKGSQWCTAATGGAITSPVAGKVFRVFGTKVLVELVL